MEFKAYFKGGKREHLLGLLGGAVWMAGAVSNFVVVNSSVIGQVGLQVSYALGQGAIFVGCLWGLLAWRDYSGSAPRSKLLLTGMFLFLAVGLAAVAFAPTFGK